MADSANVNTARAGTVEDRIELFEQIVSKIMSRDAFVPVKLRLLNLDVRRSLLRYRDEMITADTEERLFYSILKLSCARKDPHCRVSLVRDGLRLPGVEVGDTPRRIDQLLVEHAPVKFAVDFSTPGDYFVFLSDYDPDRVSTDDGQPLALGDRLVSVNGQSFADYFDCVEPYNRYATVNGLWWRLAAKIPHRTREYPPHFYRREVEYGLADRSGNEYMVRLPPLWLSQTSLSALLTCRSRHR